ncbi:MAG: citrate/2-methylcitrate synthase, partial [Methermicoccaceae archaeon]
MEDIKKGLESVIALETEISYIDGKEGILEYRGYNISEISKLSYEAVSYLIIDGKIPDEEELEDFSKQLREERAVDENAINVLRMCNLDAEAMDVLRTVVSYLSQHDSDLNDHSYEANMRKAMRLIAKLPTIVAAHYRIKNNQEPIPPDPTLSHGANFLYMLKGQKPDEVDAKLMDLDFVLSTEHELNASTFSVRVTVSVLSDIYSAIIAGLSTLKGSLHGGARMAVMDMLDEVASPENAEQHVLDIIEGKQRVMGFGHRVYKTYDPRAKIYKDLAKHISEKKGDSKWFETAEMLEQVVHREFVEKQGKDIHPNVDFYSAVVYKYLEIPPEFATAMFAIGRVSGWVAHCMEQYADNRVIRPRAKYVGGHGRKVE